MFSKKHRAITRENNSPDIGDGGRLLLFARLADAIYQSGEVVKHLAHPTLLVTLLDCSSVNLGAISAERQTKGVEETSLSYFPHLSSL